MRELSKIMRERLRVTARATAAHPDADLLTAFAERSLTGRERAGVMKHLAQCGDCREVVALALPPEVEDALVAKGGSRASWFRLPVLRWAAVAVGIAVALLAGTLNPNQTMRTRSTNELQKPETVATLAQPASSLENHAQTRATPPEAKDKLMAKQSASTALGSAARSRATIPSRAFSNGALVGSGVGVGGASSARNGAVAAAPARELARADAAPAYLTSPAVSTQAAAPPPSRPMPPAVSETVEVSSAAGPAETEQADLGSEKENFSRAKPPVDQQIVSGASSLPIQGRNVTSLQTLSSSNSEAAAPRWTIAANGALQRSFDGGTTWQDVKVTADGSLDANLTLKATTMAKAAASATAEGKTKDKKFPTFATPVFRAVAANGMEVWAGGSGGVLYHTVDAGNSWSRVVPSFSGIVVGGDIISIEFPDQQHGRLTTSTGEAWTTGDGGQTWLKLK
jgi:Photosynthesis system II assembly factor YCF48/Putative zinc-finger